MDTSKLFYLQVIWRNIAKNKTQHDRHMDTHHSTPYIQVPLVNNALNVNFLVYIRTIVSDIIRSNYTAVYFHLQNKLLNN